MNNIKFASIELKRLRLEEIETVRQWRNSPLVSQWMEYKTVITKEEQIKWFHGLDLKRQFFYTIYANNLPVGLVNIKNIENSSGEGGIFIGVEAALNQSIGIEALIAMYFFGFNNLNLENITAHILSTNKRAIRLNKMLGFKIQANQDNIQNQLYCLSRNDFNNSTKQIIAYYNSPIEISNECN